MSVSVLLSLAAASPLAEAREVTSCCTDDGCVTGVTRSRCASIAGAWARCDDDTCEIVAPDGARSATDAELTYGIGVWGYWFGAHRDATVQPLDPFDPTLVDPCNAWALEMDQDPTVCDGHLPPVNPPSNPGPVPCPDHDEIDCGFCTIEYAACVTKAAALGPVLGAGYYAFVCHPNWEDCLEDECGLEC